MHPFRRCEGRNSSVLPKFYGSAENHERRTTWQKQVRVTVRGEPPWMSRKTGSTGEGKGKAPRSQGRGAVCVNIDDMPRRELTEKEEWVCREFVADAGENQTRAYMRVYPGTTYESARTLAARMFAEVHIKNRVAELRAERNKRLEISADRVMMELAKLAFYDPRAFFDSDNRLKPTDELDPDHAAVISGIETIHKVTGDDKDGITVITKIKLPDKKGALELIGRNLKMWTDKTEMSGAVGVTGLNLTINGPQSGS